MRWKLAFLLALFALASCCQAQVKVWEGTLDIPVYEEGAPDPNPSFDQFATTRFSYPYTLRKEITNQRNVHQLRAIYLENEHLKCSVLPDIGGHVYTCTDKINGKPMFYANPSIKKALIGYRGAWAAFGVEFNFPVSHNWMSMSPVNFAYSTRPDGSASITVGNIDRVYGMEWTVELTLRPGSTVLEQKVSLSNRSDVRHRFYWWSNAGVEIWDDSKVEYPMQFAASHGFTEVQPWPVDAQGKDLSIIKNQTDGPVSVFVHGSRENFMGIWHPHTNSGTVHFAEYDQLPAKKIWSWGVDADGLDWRQALSDNDSAYAEVQGGLFRNQETYAFLEPRQQINFTEYWIPVRETGGISRANLAGVAHLSRAGENIAVALNVNRKLPNAKVQLLDGEKVLFSETEDLSPEKSWTKQIKIEDKLRRYTFELQSSDGTVLLAQTEGKYDWTPSSEIKVGPQSSYAFPSAEKRTEDDWLQFGKNAELDGDLLAALTAYQVGLKKFPTGYELQKANGRLDASLKRFESAIRNLESAHQRNTTDAEVSYYLGIAKEAIGNEKAATTFYEAAMRAPGQRSAAALRLAELKARQGYLENSRALLAESLRLAPDDLRAEEEYVAVLRALGKTEDARKHAESYLQEHPLSAFLKEELGSPDLRHLSADPYRVLNMASQYARLGMYRDAVRVLSRDYPVVATDQSEPGTDLPQKNPLVVYFRGYCREKLGESGAHDFAEASKLSTLYVFPSTVEDKVALEAALRSNPSDATARSLLGTWFFARAMTDEALREWQAARSVNPKIPALSASTGLALLHEKRDFATAAKVFEEGIQYDPKNPVNYTGAVSSMTLLGRPAADRIHALERYPDKNAMPTPLAYELILNKAEAGDFQGAIDLFRGRFFGREEGGTNVRQVWIEVKLMQALDLAKSGRCPAALDTASTIGNPVEGFAFTKDGLEAALTSARANYLLGTVFELCGKKLDAAQKFEQAAKATATQELVWAWAAARNLPGYQQAVWNQKLKRALETAGKAADTSSYQGWWNYTEGALLLAIGEKSLAKEKLTEVFLQPESRLSYHFARLALAGATPQ